MTALVITASGTGVGKTMVTTALVHQLRRCGREVAAYKPVISGYAPDDPGSDTAILLQAQGREHTPETATGISPWRFAAPLSPDMAAHREGREIDFANLTDFCHRRARGPETAILFEGVGGVMVPLTETHTTLDWMAALTVPVWLVVGSYLGTLNHSLTAAAALRQRGIALAAVVVSESEESPVPLAETAAALARFLPRVTVRPIPRQPGDTPWQHCPDLTDLPPLNNRVEPTQ